jgi:hypothetical protein
LSKNEKRPPWYRPLERAKWEIANTTYRDLKAYLMPPDEAEEWDVELPPNWYSAPVQWIQYQLAGGKKAGLPPSAGKAFVQSPFADIYTRVYGVEPISDLPKYRTMVRSQPDINAALEKQVSMAFGKGFEISHPDPEIEAYLEEVVDRIRLREEILALAFDMLAYGNAYAEIVWEDRQQTQENLYNFKGTYYPESEIKGKTEFSGAKVVQRDGKTATASMIKNSNYKDIITIKILDPIYMRVRRDSFNNIYGYLQRVVFPPVLLDTASCLHIKYRPKSWGYENAYGTSVLLPLIKNNDLLMQFENDASIWIHQRAVPPLIVRGGTEAKPYTTAQMKELMKSLQGRSAASMLAVKSDVEIQEMEGVARALNVNWYLNYLLHRRYQSLGVPPSLMGVQEGASGNRGTIQTVLQEFITQLQLLQKFVAEAIESQILYPLIVTNFGDTWVQPKGKKPKRITMPKAKLIYPPIVEEAPDLRSTRLIQGLQAGAISINEYRERTGFPAIDDPKYDEIRGQPAEPPTKAKGTFPSPQWSKPPPEGTKREEYKGENNLEKLILERNEEFSGKMVGLLEKVRSSSETKNAEKVKKKVLEESERLINAYSTDIFLAQKIENGETAEVEKDEILKINALRELLAEEFRNNVEGVVKNKD